MKMVQVKQQKDGRKQRRSRALCVMKSLAHSSWFFLVATYFVSNVKMRTLCFYSSLFFDIFCKENGQLLVLSFCGGILESSVNTDAQFITSGFVTSLGFRV
jgi:hypothetical protein